MMTSTVIAFPQTAILAKPRRRFPWNTVMVLIDTWRERRDNRITLVRLDAHMLADIGMTPEDAEAEINKPFWRA